jgi:transcriptional regulator with XRE-family HTH domain
MIETLRSYSSMIRERRNELGITCAELCVRAGVSTKTLSLIENEQWPKNGKLSDHQKRGQAKSIVGLSMILSFDLDEWREKLDLPRHTKTSVQSFLLDKEALEYLIRVIEVTGPIRSTTAFELLGQRKK